MVEIDEEEEHRRTTERETVELEVAEKKKQAENLSERLSRKIGRFINKFKNTDLWKKGSGETAEKMSADKKSADDFVRGDGQGLVPTAKDYGAFVLKDNQKEKKTLDVDEIKPKDKKLPAKMPEKKLTQPQTKESRESFLERKMRRLEAYKRLMRIRAMQNRRVSERKKAIRERAIRFKNFKAAETLRQVDPSDKQTMQQIKDKVRETGKAKTPQVRQEGKVSAKQNSGNETAQSVRQGAQSGNQSGGQAGNSVGGKSGKSGAGHGVSGGGNGGGGNGGGGGR